MFITCLHKKTCIQWSNTSILLVTTLDRILSWATTSVQRPNISGLKVTALDRFHCIHIIAFSDIIACVINSHKNGLHMQGTTYIHYYYQTYAVACWGEPEWHMNACIYRVASQLVRLDEVLINVLSWIATEFFSIEM